MTTKNTKKLANTTPVASYEMAEHPEGMAYVIGDKSNLTLSDVIRLSADKHPLVKLGDVFGRIRKARKDSFNPDGYQFVALAGSGTSKGKGRQLSIDEKIARAEDRLNALKAEKAAPKVPASVLRAVTTLRKQGISSEQLTALLLKAS